MGENAAELLRCSLSERVSGLVPRVLAEMGAVSRNQDQEIKKKWEEIECLPYLGREYNKHWG